MSKRPTVTKAQIRRTVEAFEAVGKTVVGAVLRADGSWEVKLTDGSSASLSSPERDEFAEWATRHGYG